MKAQYIVSVLASKITRFFTNLFGCGTSALQVLKSDAHNTSKYQCLDYRYAIIPINGSLQTILTKFKSIINRTCGVFIHGSLSMSNHAFSKHSAKEICMLMYDN